MTIVYEDDITDLWCPFCGEQIKKNGKWIGHKINERTWESKTHAIEPDTKRIVCRNQSNTRIVNYEITYDIIAQATAWSKTET